MGRSRKAWLLLFASHRKVLWGLVALMAAAPLFLGNGYWLGVLITANIFALFAVTWDFASGYTSQMNFGHAAFVGSGAYTAALLNLRLGAPLWVTLPAGAAVAALMTLIIGAPSIRLRGPYFALVTLVFAEVLNRLVLLGWKVTGGWEGLSDITPLSSSGVRSYYWSLLFLLACTGLLWGIMRSRWGVVIRSVGENEQAAEAAGINTFRYKLLVFLLSGALAGLAGAFYAHYQTSVVVSNILSVNLSVVVLILAVVGGMGTVIGPVAGSYVLVFLNELLLEVGDYRFMLYVVLFTVIILFQPRGLFPPVAGALSRLWPQRSLKGS